MRIPKDFLREAIQFVAIKRPPIAFKIEEGVTDRKLGESRTYKLCAQLEEDNSPVYSLTVEVKQILRGKNMGDMDATYTLVQDLLRGSALTAFNNKQVTFEEQMADNLKHCLNAVTVQVFPNKAYKLQKWYIQHMMHKPRHNPVYKWIARVVKLNNYLVEFLMPTGVEARKLEQEELLEVLENRIPISWKFQMDKEGFNMSSSTLKEFTKTCVCYKECKLKVTKKISAACKSHSKRGGKCKAKCKASKKAGHHFCKYHGYCNHAMDECRITIKWCKEIMLHERGDRSCKSKKVHFSSGKAKSCKSLSNGNKDLHSIINKKIVMALSHQEKKDLNKFEALSILSGGDDGNNSNSDSRVNNTSNKEMNSE
eukprot:6183228-Ditylum_brightwellii.AAC.1